MESERSLSCISHRLAGKLRRQGRSSEHQSARSLHRAGRRTRCPNSPSKKPRLMAARSAKRARRDRPRLCRSRRTAGCSARQEGSRRTQPRRSKGLQAHRAAGAAAIDIGLAILPGSCHIPDTIAAQRAPAAAIRAKCAHRPRPPERSGSGRAIRSAGRRCSRSSDGSWRTTGLVDGGS